MRKPKDYRAVIGNTEYLPIVIGGMGVDVSTSAMVLEAARLGCIGHLSDAMVPALCDRHFGTTFTKNKAERYHRLQAEEPAQVHVPQFNPQEYRLAQMQYISNTVEKKQGTGGVFVNCMEKLQIGSAREILEVRLRASLDAGVDGITLSAGLHGNSMKMMSEHPRFRDAKIGIIVSSWRALRLFLRSASRVDRMPDYIVVEGPLAGGHLGFGDDWTQYVLKEIVADVMNNLEQEGLKIPVIPAGGIFDAEDTMFFLEMGAAAVQVATRFTVAKESGLTDTAKQTFFEAEENDVFVAPVSPTGYPIRLLRSSPCLNSNIAPQCIPLGYAMDSKGRCQYVDAYNATGISESGKKLPVVEKMCLCYHIGRYDTWTCGASVVRLKETAERDSRGIYQQPTTEQIIQEYLGERTAEVKERQERRMCVAQERGV
ncbi:MAG: nitronate monooxygenase [Planctomycetaceae bacterium]|nr:nitronate monooxygenase [Planctomycetaceae bacterium]